MNLYIHRVAGEHSCLLLLWPLTALVWCPGCWLGWRSPEGHWSGWQWRGQHHLKNKTKRKNMSVWVSSKSQWNESIYFLILQLKHVGQLERESRKIVITVSKLMLFYYNILYNLVGRYLTNQIHVSTFMILDKVFVLYPLTHVNSSIP